MDTQKSATVLPNFIKSLRQWFTRQIHPVSESTPQDDRQPAQRSQQQDELIAAQFHRFPDLPTELRLQIWAEATRYKRYVVLQPACNDIWGYLKFIQKAWMWSIGDDPSREPWPIWTSGTPVPSLLSVSREAREVGLKTWQLAFGFEGYPAGVYFNFDQDDVVVGANARANKVGEAFMSRRRWVPFDHTLDMVMMGWWTNTPDIEKIQRLVACGDFMRRVPRQGINMFAPLGFMTGLKSLTLVRIGKYKVSSSRNRVTYTIRGPSDRGRALLSLDGVDFVKCSGTDLLTGLNIAELEILDFVGETPWAEIQSRWTVGPDGYASDPVQDLPNQVRLGPGRTCAKRAILRHYTYGGSVLRYAL